LEFTIRLATVEDADDITQLIARSSRALSVAEYTPEQIELALTSALGLDTQLIKDKSFFVVEIVDDTAPKIVGCGGWSFRVTLFGNDAEKNRNPAIIDVASGAAKIRAFFVDGDYSRQGIGSMILEKCEAEAIQAGYTEFELMSTLSGLKLYQHYGYVAGKAIEYPLNEQLTIRFVPMFKTPDKI